MSDLYPQVLREMLVQHGRGVCNDPRRVKALLRDYLGVHPGNHEQAINLLVLALENRVAAELLGSGGLPAEMVRNRLASRLHTSLGLTEQAAAWAVAAWAEVLLPRSAVTTMPASASTPLPRPVTQPIAASRPTDAPAAPERVTSVTEALDTALPARPAAGLRAPGRKLVWFGLGAALVVIGLCGGLGLTLLLTRGPGETTDTPVAGKDADDKGKTKTITPAPPKAAAWVVLFRSADPSIWNSEVNEGENRFAKAVASAPEGTRYLRLRRSKDQVILPITRDKLGVTSQVGRYGWNGSADRRFASRLLGIFDTKLPFRLRDQVMVRWGPGGPPCSGWGFGHKFGAGAEQGYCWNGEALPTSAVFEIAVSADELPEPESAHLLTKPVKTEPIQPAQLAGAGISKDWTVIFCSGDPGIWNQNVQRGPTDFAKAVAGLPDNIRYLRARRNSEYVIIEMTRERLGKLSEDGQIGWNGTSEYSWAGHHLGIFDRRHSAENRGDVAIRIQPSFSGWGFGNFTQVDDQQGYCWEGRPIPPTTLEFAVKSTDLTAAEAKNLRRHVVQCDPIKPATLAGPGISKDWTVLFCSANPRIWDRDVKDGPSNSARTLAGLPDDLRYLRIRRDADFVILPMTRDRLKITNSGRYGWSGQGEEDSGAIHLGIFDSQNRCNFGDICIRSLPWCQGWGFGHIHFKANVQGYCWDGRPVPVCVLEIAVKRGDLTETETKKLLR